MILTIAAFITTFTIGFIIGCYTCIYIEKEVRNSVR